MPLLQTNGGVEGRCYLRRNTSWKWPLKVAEGGWILEQAVGGLLGTGDTPNKEENELPNE